MKMSLVLKNNEDLTTEEKQDIDKQIDKIIKQHKDNSFEINRLVFDSVTALTASEARSNELTEQGMLKRFFGGITGKNQRLQSEIDNGLAKAQYASQQTLQKLAEQNLMSFELIAAINNKLNSSIIEIESEMSNVYDTLLTFFKQTKSDLIQIENRVDRIEKNVNLLNWVNTIEYQMYKGVEYVELDRIEKIVCIASDFYYITKGSWTTSDLLLLKSALSEIDLSRKEKISYKQFIEYISENRELISSLIQEEFKEFSNIDNNELSIIKGVTKVKLLESDEKYIVNTVKEQLAVHGVIQEEKNLRYSILENYIAKTTSININSQVNIYDFILELLLNVKMCEYIMLEKYNDLKLDFENMKFEVVKKYAEHGNGEAQNRLGNIYYEGEDVVRDYEKAEKLYKLSANQGNAEAQNKLGNIYEDGKGVERDYVKAVRWYKLSAEQGHANAQYRLGDMYYFEKGVNKDYKEAIYWYIKSANQGNEAAQYSLGYMYQYGQGIEKDYKEAVKWYKLSSEQGYAKSQYCLGKCYEDGLGIEKDDKLTVYWHEKSAKQGNAAAQDQLGSAYAIGYGVRQDYNKAIYWLSKAVEQGNADAQCNLGLLYLDGKGLKKDREKARELFLKSAEQGLEKAKRILKKEYNEW